MLLPFHILSLALSLDVFTQHLDSKSKLGELEIIDGEPQFKYTAQIAHSEGCIGINEGPNFTCMSMFKLDDLEYKLVPTIRNDELVNLQFVRMESGSETSHLVNKPRLSKPINSEDPKTTETGAKEPTILQKYWMYILPAGAVLVSQYMRN